MISIEYAHIYTDSQFSDEQHAGAVLLKLVSRDIKIPFNTCVMIDDYSTGGDLDFKYENFINDLSRESHVKPSLIIKESTLININRFVLWSIDNTREGKDLIKYIDRTTKHPCSLFIASWYLLRLGAFDLSELTEPPLLNNNFKSKIKLINILPEHFQENERKAWRILKHFICSTSIKNYYHQ